MADTKPSAFTEDSTPTSGDGFPFIEDIGGTPANKITDFDDLQTAVLADAFVVAGTPTDGYVVMSDEGTPTWMPAPSGGGGGATGTGATQTANAGTSVPYVDVVGHASAHTKGTWTELIASSSFDAETVIVTVGAQVGSNGVDTSTLLDIGVGASSSETVLIPDLFVGGAAMGATYEFPLAVASGTRVSARLQSGVSEQSVSLCVSLREAGTHSAAATACTAMGVSSSGASDATQLPSPGTANTETAWTELVASTASTYTKLVVVVGFGAGNAASSTGLVDIAVGAASSETPIISNIGYSMAAAETVTAFGACRWFDVNIPSGSRVSVRHQNSGSQSGNRPCVAVYGMA